MEFIGLSPAGLNGIPAEDPAKDDGRPVDRRAGHGPRPARRPAVVVRRPRARSRTPSPRSPRPAARPTASCTCWRSPTSSGSPLDIDEFGAIADRTPIVADLQPGGRFTATDIYEAGGVALVMRELLKRDLLDGDAPTVDGRTIAEIAAAVERDARPGGRRPDRASAQADRRTRRSSTAALAPDGCVVKLAGHERRFHRGPARVFDSETACYEAVRDRRIVRRRRRRDPLRGTGRRTGHAGDAERDERARRARASATRSP